MSCDADCAVCIDGYAEGPGARCHKCSGENRGWIVALSTTGLVFVLFATLLGVQYLLQMVGGGAEEAQDQSRSSWQDNLLSWCNVLAMSIPLSAIRILLVVLQILVQFTQIAGTVYPDEYDDFLSMLALANFDIGSILSGSCLLTPNFFDKLVIATVTPLAILSGCSGTFHIANMRNWHSSTARLVVKHKHLSIALFIVFVVYSSVSFTIFQTFVCDSLDDGNAYLRADYCITCFTERHNFYRMYAMLMVCVYPVGIPVFFAWWLVRNRRDLLKPERETLPCLRSYRCLWSAYRPSCYYYEVVECGRRIVLTGAGVFVAQDSPEQVAFILFLAVVFVFISESISPFKSKADMWLYRWGNGFILASMYVALLLKVDLAGSGSHSALAMTVLLIAAHVFMMFAVAVQAVLLMRVIRPSTHWSPDLRSRIAGLGADHDVIDGESEEAEMKA